MKKITAYKLSNGEIVENIDKAMAKEKAIKFEKEVRKLIDGIDEFVYAEDKDNVFYFIKDNKDKLLKILKDAE